MGSGGLGDAMVSIGTGFVLTIIMYSIYAVVATSQSISGGLWDLFPLLFPALGIIAAVGLFKYLS